jgi:hypothetical protein
VVTTKSSTRSPVISNAEAARWLRMMLTDTNLAAVPQSDPFYADAQRVNALLTQFREIQQRQGH